jgi:hypothetical protein
LPCSRAHLRAIALKGPTADGNPFSSTVEQIRVPVELKSQAEHAG